MKFERQKGFRVHRYFMGVTNFDGLWWLEKSKYWESEINDIPKDENYSSHAPCRTIRAFRRHLRKHPEIRGKAVLASRLRGHDVFA